MGSVGGDRPPGNNHRGMVLEMNNCTREVSGWKDSPVCWVGSLGLVIVGCLL